MPVDPTSPRGKQAKLFAEKQEEEWRRAQERQAAVKKDPADDSDQSDDTATFITVGTETFVTTVDQQFLENDDIDPRDWDPPPSERIDGNPSTVHGAEEYPAVEGYAAKTRKKKKGPKAVGKKLGIKITDDQISTSIATWQAAVEEDGIDDADLFLGKLKMQNPDRVLGVIADRVSSAALQGPQQVFLNDNSLGQIPESVWTLSGFQSIRELFLQTIRLISCQRNWFNRCHISSCSILRTMSCRSSLLNLSSQCSPGRNSSCGSTGITHWYPHH